MRGTFISMASALLLGRVLGQASPCEVGCVDGVFAQGTTLGCASGDSLCMCGKSTDLDNGIRDCVTNACSGDQSSIDLALSIGDSRCAAASSSAGLAPTSAPTTAPTSTVAPTTTAATTTPATTESETTTPVTTSAETTASPSPTISSAPSSSSPAASSSVAPSSSWSTSPSPSSSPSPSPSPTGTSGSTPDENTGDSKGTADSDESSDDGSSSGLSTAAKAGIGAGVGVAVIMAAMVAICMVMRRKQREKDARRGRELQISQPLPGAGRMYAAEEEAKLRNFSFPVASVVSPPPRYSPNSRNIPTPQSSNYGGRNSYSSELDRNARPYEEMLPRTQPRTMI